jgi:hypothetical protein
LDLIMETSGVNDQSEKLEKVGWKELEWVFDIILKLYSIRAFSDMVNGVHTKYISLSKEKLSLQLLVESEILLSLSSNSSFIQTSTY